MPSIAQVPMNSLKRRRVEPDDMELQTKSSSSSTTGRPFSPLDPQLVSYHPPCNEDTAAREKERLINTPRSRAQENNKRLRFDHASLLACAAVELANPSMSKSDSDRTSHDPVMNGSHTPPKQAAMNLSPCHICRRKPCLRSELSAYVTCAGCGRRTCYVCKRECLGPLLDDNQQDIPHPKSGWKDSLEEERLNDPTEMSHRGIICSRCCIETGVDGEIRCLACAKAEEAWPS